MAATTKTELWQLAATIMGSNASTEILNADSPTTPLERTFSYMYDQVRRLLIRRGQWDFCRRTYALREAPTIDWARQTHVWDKTGMWRYVYGMPPDSIQFIQFADEEPNLGLVHPKRLLTLPIKYEELVGTVAAGIVTFAASDIYSRALYRHWMEGSVIDDSQTKRTIRDLENSATSDFFKFVDKETSFVLTTVASVDARYDDSVLGSGSILFSLAAANAAGVYDFSGGGYPTNVVITLASGNPHSTNPAIQSWSEHIFTNAVSPTAIYLADVTTISLWPYEAQVAVATEMAFRASKVHAKSTKMIQILAQEAQQSFIDSVEVDTSGNDTLGDRISSAERSRW